MNISAKKILNSIQKFYNQNKSSLEQNLIVPKKRHKKIKFSLPSIACILILYHVSGYKTFKYFYFDYVSRYLKRLFPDLPSYSWFLRIEKSAIFLMLAYLQSLKGKQTGIYFIDSTPIKVCNNRRIHNHKTFAGLAERGHHSMGWFYGFKLHLIINEKGEIMEVYFSKGNKDDRIGLEKMGQELEGLLIGDKGYISSEHRERLAKQGLKLITKVRKNMQPVAMSRLEKSLLYRRTLVETVIGQLKSLYEIENAKIRSVWNIFTNLLGALLCYTINPTKPALNLYSQPLIRN